MKIAITGAAGHLGQCVVRALHSEGHEIVATDQTFTRDLPVRLEVLDLCDANGCYRLLEGCEVLLHLGNHPGVHPHKPQTLFVNNVTTNANVFQAAVDNGVRKIIYASSIQAVSGERLANGDVVPPSLLPYLPLDGHLPPNPGSLYGISKMAGEDLLAFYARQFGLSTISIRFPLLLDPVTAKSLRERVMRNPFLDEGFSYLAHPDAATLFTALLKANLPGFRTYLPASPGTLLPIPVEEIIARHYPKVPRRTPSPHDNLVDVSEITRDTGWVPQCRLFSL